MAVPESGGAGKGSNGEAVGSGAVDKHAAVVRRAAGIASVEAKRSATADVRRAAGASGTVGYPDGGGRRDDEPVREELHGSGGDYNDPSKSKRVRGEPHVERALSAVFRGEETHVERVPSEEVFGEADVEQDLGDAVNYLRGDEDYVGREITVDVRCGAHVKVKRAAELPDEVLVEELDGQNDCELTAVFRGEEAYVEPAPGWEVRGEDAAEAYVERALSAVFRGEETHVERVPSEEVFGEADVEQDLGDAVNYLRGDEDYVGREITVDVLCGAHVKVKRAAELPDEVLVEELDGQNDCALTAVFRGEEAYVEPALGGEVRREHGEEVHVEPAPGGEVRREHGEEVHVEHVVVLDHEPVEATAGLVLGAPVPAAVRAAVLEARALKNMEGAKAAKEARKLWERGNLNGSNNGCNSNSPSPSEKRRFADPKEKIFQKFDVEASYLTGNEDSDSKYRRLVDLFNQMISLMEAVEHGLSLEDSKDLEREMKSTIHEIRKMLSSLLLDFCILG
uniref:Uncharacterized protein n=1 Tax=Oryza sativa subsp. japonica TaxID=39947 RepID=Q2R1A7_ORYSJ|nr:hypothetical protein LOC_Os11g39810 [Oryza sativa Japonica Group]